MGLARRLLALVGRLTAWRRHFCPDGTACVLWMAALIAVALWLMGLL